MKRVMLALATLLLVGAVMPAADARIVQPPWVVVRGRIRHMTGVLIPTPEITACPFVSAGSSASIERPAPSTD